VDAATYGRSVVSPPNWAPVPARSDGRMDPAGGLTGQRDVVCQAGRSSCIAGASATGCCYLTVSAARRGAVHC